MGFQQLIDKITAPPWPDAKPLPAKVRDMKLNIEALALHMSRAHEPNRDVETGYGKKAKQ